MKHLYIICAYLGENSKAEPTYIAESLEEAQEKLANYAERYTPREVCQVKKVTKDLNVIATYWFDSGTLVKTEYTYAVFDILQKRILWKGKLKDCRRWLKNLKGIAPEDKERCRLLNLNKEYPAEQ